MSTPQIEIEPRPRSGTPVGPLTLVGRDAAAAPAAAGGLPRKRTFVVLRLGFLLTAIYLLLVARDFRSPDLNTSLLIAAALGSNLLLTAVPVRYFEGVRLVTAVILGDMAMVTAALLLSGEFGGEFFLLYFAVIFLAAVGESVSLITIAALVGSGVYFWLGAGQEGVSFWTSDRLIRFPFLLMVAVFFGYFVVRLRQERRRALEEADSAASLEQARRSIARHAREVEEANRRLEVEVKERAQAEKELEDANAKLELASQTKTDFISVVSHELRTPLASIKNALDLVDSGKAGELNEQQRRFLGMALRNTARLSAIIDDLLDLSKVEAGGIEYQWAETDLERLLVEIRRNFDSQADAGGVRLELKCSSRLPKVYVDVGRIEQVVTNLVSNAIRHTPAGGSVTIWARPVAEGAEVAVWDTGVGIAAEDQVRIFERFYQVGDSLTRQAKGTGLGLSIVKQLLAGHGSRVHVESEPDKGSRFWFRLPTLSSETVEAFDLEASVVRYKAQASFFTLLVVRLASGETGHAAALPDREELEALHRAIARRFPRSTDHVVLQRASGRILVTLLMTPISGARVVKERLGEFLREEERRGRAPLAVISGPASFPEDGTTGREVLESALNR